MLTMKNAAKRLSQSEDGDSKQGDESGVAVLKESGTGLCIETGGKSMDPTSPVISPMSGAKAMSSIKSSQQSHQIRAHLN